MNYYGIRHNTNQWIVNFLEGRTQQVLVEGVKSTTALVHSGVPWMLYLWLMMFLLLVMLVTWHFLGWNSMSQSLSHFCSCSRSSWTTNSNSLLPNTASNDTQQHVNSANSGDVDIRNLTVTLIPVHSGVP
jgi:hypothetical protein